MIVLTSGEFEDRSDVFVFQVRVVGEDLLSRGAGGQKVEDILDTNAEPADARTTAAHVGIYGDSVNGAHVSVPLPPASEPRLYPDETGSTFPPALARRLGSHLLTEATELRPELGFDSYDRLFRSQDTMPLGGFGNLFALPLR
jgi:hypothetical protein